jgi:hypothetical protein
VCRTHAAGALVDGPGLTTLVLLREGIDCLGVEGRREPSAPQRTPPAATRP